MTKFVVILLLVLLVVVLARMLSQSAVAGPAPKRGWLDDDGVKRGDRWDGSWLRGPLTAAV